MGPPGSEPSPVAGTFEKYTQVPYSCKILSISSVRLFKVQILTARRKTPLNIVAVVILLLKSET